MAAPLHIRLKEDVITAIRTGSYPPGSQLPSQRELGVQYAASHMTVRRAIDELLHEGVITSIPGRGLFAAVPRQQAETSPLLSFSADMRQRGLTPSSVLLDAQITSASTVIGQVLRVAVGTAIIYLRRLRQADCEPIAVQTAYLPATYCPELLDEDLTNGSLFELLRQNYGLQLAASDSTVTCALADAETAELLGLTLPAAVLVTEQLTLLEDGTPIEFVRSSYRGDRYEIRLTHDLGIRGQGSGRKASIPTEE